MEKFSRKILWISFAILLFAGLLLAYLVADNAERYFFSPRDLPDALKPGVDVPAGQESGESAPLGPAIFADNLEIPWEIAFLPAGDLLVTERPGRLTRIDKDGNRYEISGIAGPVHRGEGGLLGIALHPEFSENKYIYLYFTYSIDGGNLLNRVSRYKLENDVLSDELVIVDGIPGASNHDGGRIEFGPDGMLYITTGDSGNSNLAQNLGSLAGKILRVRDDGSPPISNPFLEPLGSGRVPNSNTLYVWSYGHRNPQGMTWDSEGNLWATEHGRSGVASGFDELNLIEPGKNYGWPTIQGDGARAGMEKPVIHSGADYTWAPGDAEYVDGSIFFTGLRGSALYEAKIEGRKVKEIKAHFANEFGRLRAVRLGPDGHLYITTSNRDGRGTIREGDDKIIKINPEIF